MPEGPSAGDAPRGEGRALSAFANAVLGAGALYCLAIVGYVLLFSGAGVVGSVKGLVFLWAPAAVALGFLGALRLNVKRRAGIAGVALSVGVALYSAEALLWLVSPGIDRAAENKSERNREAILRPHRERGRTILPPMVPARLVTPRQGGEWRSEIDAAGRELLALGGVSGTIVAGCGDDGEHFNIYESDEFGFHNPPGSWSAAPAAIGAVGDSVTHGDCVGADQGFVELIRARVPRTLNLGMLGNGPLTMLAGVTEYLSRMRPRHVLWVHTEQTDLIYDLFRERSTPLLMRYLEEGFDQRLADRQREIDRLFSAYLARRAGRGAWSGLSRFARLASLRGLLRLPYFHDPGVAEQRRPDYALFERILNTARARVEAWGGTLHFVYFPAAARFHGDARLFEDQRREVTALLDRLDIPLIDLAAAFAADDDPRRFHATADSHPNQTGHRLAAEAILRAPGMGTVE